MGRSMRCRAIVVALSLVVSGAALADDLGLEVFTKIAQPSCALCHTLQAAGATGAVGPSLDELAPDRERVVRAVRDGVGVMPSFDGQLTPQQIEAVAEFVAKVTARH
ncbi:MAG: cytochrome c [Burkholderiaceae bacterium]|nr:cytochrome c [Burkholderiaceae bacterium]